MFWGVGILRIDILRDDILGIDTWGVAILGRTTCMYIHLTRFMYSLSTLPACAAHDVIDDLKDSKQR